LLTDIYSKYKGRFYTQYDLFLIYVTFFPNHNTYLNSNVLQDDSIHGYLKTEKSKMLKASSIPEHFLNTPIIGD